MRKIGYFIFVIVFLMVVFVVVQPEINFDIKKFSNDTPLRDFLNIIDSTSPEYSNPPEYTYIYKNNGDSYTVTDNNGNIVSFGDNGNVIYGEGGGSSVQWSNGTNYTNTYNYTVTTKSPSKLICNISDSIKYSNGVWACYSPNS